MKLSLNPILNAVNAADKIIGRFKPSLEEKSKASLDQYNAETHRLEVTKDERMADHEERMQRLKIEQALAQSKEAAKIRPMLGKVCIGGFIITLAPYAVALIITTLSAFGLPVEPFTEENFPPRPPQELLYTLAFTAVGQSGMRTLEKLRKSEGNRG